MTASTAVLARAGERPATVIARLARRNGYGIALIGFLALMVVFTRVIHPSFGSRDLANLASAAMPLAFAAAAQAVIVIAGGIDLSIGPMMALTNVVAAVLMEALGDPASAGVVVLVLALGIGMGTINGGLVVTSRVPDIVVTLAMSFVWAGVALLILQRPDGNAADWFESLARGPLVVDFLPKALVVLLATVGLVWLPLRQTRVGLSLYAIGSDRLAAYRSGVNVNRTKVVSYTLGGLFAACGGLAITMTTGIGAPVPGDYTLAGVAAIVLGGVSLAGGRGGLVGPIAAAFILALLRLDLIFLRVDPNLGLVIRGTIMVVVVMIGGFVTLRRLRA